MAKPLTPASTGPDPTRRALLSAAGAAALLLPMAVGAAASVLDIGLFADAAAAAIPADAMLVHSSGHSRSGLGAADYRFDPTVDAAFVRAHPRAAFLAADGRGFRLAGAALTVEQLGAIGDGVTNDQPAIQAAVAYAEATGPRGIGFAAARYAVWTRPRTSPHATHRYDGEAIVVSRRILFRGLHPGGSTLLLRNVDGRELAAHWQTSADGAVWRGSGLMLRGYPSWNAERNAEQPAPAGHELPGITLIDMTLDGGADRAAATTAIFPADPKTGRGWDVTHRGIYAEEDNHCGDITLIRSRIVRFRGELVYQGGAHQGAIRARDSYFGHSNGDLVNPCGSDLELVNCTFEDGWQGFEGWGGRAGRIVDCTFRNCRTGAGRLQGGRTNSGTVAARYYRPVAPVPGEVPWLTLAGVRFVDCDAVYVGSWVRGRIEAVDTQVLLQAYGDEDRIHDVDLDLVATCDASNGLFGVVLASSPTPGTKAIGNVRLRVMLRTTARARSAGRGFERGVAFNGSFGDNVVIEDSSGPARRYPADELAGTPRATPDMHPCFRANAWTRPGTDWNGCATDVAARPLVTIDGDHHLLFRGASRGVVPFISLVTRGYSDGHEVLIAGEGPTGMVCSFARGTGFGPNARSRVLMSGQTIALRFDARSGWWEEVQGRQVSRRPRA